MAARSWTRSPCRRPISGGRSINCARWSTASCRQLVDGAARPAAADLERAVRHRRRTADAGHAAGRKPAGSIARRSSSSPATPVRRRSPAPGRATTAQRSFRNLPPALRDKYFVAARGPVERGARAAAPRLLRRRQPGRRRPGGAARRRRRSSSAATCSSISPIAASAGPWRRSSSRCPSPAYLCVGASESLLRRTSPFDLQEIGGAFVYVKGASPTSSAALQCRASRGAS